MTKNWRINKSDWKKKKNSRRPRSKRIKILPVWSKFINKKSFQLSKEDLILNQKKKKKRKRRNYWFRCM